MLSLETWVGYLLAALALAFAPGPGMLYVLSRTISGGRSTGIASTCGTAVGGTVHVLCAAIGISAILSTSAVAFTILKWLGAAFLIYLGLRMLYSAFQGVELVEPLNGSEGASQFKPAFIQGIVVEVLNPKTAIFFLAFIPQFVDPSYGFIFGQFVLLGMIVVVLNTIPDLLIACFSRPVENLWKSSYKFRTAQQATSGVCLLGLGFYLAFSESNKRL